MGKRLGPRICSELGTDRSAFPQANSIQCYGGVVPKQHQSGDTWIDRHRKSANHTLKHNLFLWAKVSVMWCPWARAFYNHEVKRGKWSAETYGTRPCAIGAWRRNGHGSFGSVGRSANLMTNLNGSRASEKGGRGFMKQP